MPRLNLVVAGFDRLATALEATGQFGQVHSVASTGGLRDVIAGGILSGSKDELVFLFADTLTVDTPQTVDLLVSKLSSTGWKVVVIALSPNANDLVVANPGAGLLEGPFTVNLTLGAIAGLGFADLNPVPDGHDVIDAFAAAPPANPFATSPTPAAPVAPFAATPAPTAPDPVVAPAPWASNPAPPAAAPASSPWGDAPAAPTTPAPWDTAGQPAAPASSPWGDAPAEPAAPVARPALAPRQEDRAPLAPRVDAPAPPVGDPWGSAPVAPAPPAPAPPAPLAAPAPPADPWGSAPVAPAADPWGSAPVAAEPAAPSWGAPTGPPVVADSGPSRRPSLADLGGFSENDAAPAPPPPAWDEAPAADPNQWSTVPGAVPGGLAPRADAYPESQVRPNRRGWVVTVTSPKGGTGKSSLTLNMAAYLGLRLREQGKTVCVIDANFQQADAGKLLNQYSPNITNIVRDIGSLVPERIQTHLVHRHEWNLSVLLGPATPTDANPVYINARLYTQILEVLRQLYDYIIIDTPVAELYHDIFTNFALPEADYIVVPVAPAIHTLMNADGWLQSVTSPRHAGGMGVDPQKVGIVLNQAQEGIDCSEDDVRRELSSWQFIGAIPLTKEWIRAGNNNELVAPRNYHELNEAFNHILYAATGEETLMGSGGVGSTSSSSADNPVSKFFKRFRK